MKDLGSKHLPKQAPQRCFTYLRIRLACNACTACTACNVSAACNACTACNACAYFAACISFCVAFLRARVNNPRMPRILCWLQSKNPCNTKYLWCQKTHHGGGASHTFVCLPVLPILPVMPVLPVPPGLPVRSVSSVLPMTCRQ